MIFTPQFFNLIIKKKKKKDSLAKKKKREEVDIKNEEEEEEKEDKEIKVGDYKNIFFSLKSKKHWFALYLTKYCLRDLEKKNLMLITIRDISYINITRDQ